MNAESRQIAKLVRCATTWEEGRDVRGGAFSSGAGRGEDENPRGGPGRGRAKKRVNQLIQKFDKSAYIVTGGFVLQYGALINENITFPDF